MKKGIPPSLTSRQTLWLAVSGLAVTALVAIAFLPPFVDAEVRPLIMAGYRKICHQLPGRSFVIRGHPVALCHRCVGIWSAVPLAIVLFSLLRRYDAILSARPGLAVLASLVPLGIDWTADFTGLWTNTVLSRFLTGAIFGLVAGYFLARVIVTSVRSGGSATEASPDSKTDEA